MTNVDMRLVYENAKIALQKAFPDIPNIASICKLTQSDYRFEQPLVAGGTLYTFPVLNNQQMFSNTEKRLLQQDSAIIYQLGVFLGLPASATDTAWTPQTYPNNFLWGANAGPAKALYNGYLSIAVNNDILIPNWSLFKHKQVPQTQQTATLASGFPEDELNGYNAASSSFFPIEPNLVLIGSKNNVIQIALPEGISAVPANSRVIVIVHAITAQNSTVVS